MSDQPPTTPPCWCPFDACSDCEYQALPQPIEGQTDIYEHLEEQ